MMKEETEGDGSFWRIDEAKVQNDRTNMALLHFIMTAPKWSISLFLFLAARQSPIPTFEDGVQKPLEHLRVAFDMESQAYQECVVSAGMTLQNELQLMAQEDYDRVTKIHETNEEFLFRAKKQRDLCLGEAKNARDLLVDWQDQGYSVDLVDDESVCSVSQRDEMERLLGGEAQLLEEVMTDEWSHHVEASLRGFHLIRDYSEARIQYDYDYFVGLRIRPALDFIATLPDIDTPVLSIDKAAIQARVATALEGLKQAMREAEAIIEALKARVDELGKSIQEFYEAYLVIYNRLLKASVFVVDFLPPGVPIPDFFDISDLPVAEAMLPSFVDLEALDMDMAAVYSLIDQTAQTCMRIIQDVMDELREQSARVLLGAVDHIHDALSAMLQLEDYDPPKFVGSQAGSTSIVDEVEYQEKVARATVNDTKELLARLSSIPTTGTSPSASNITLDAPDEILPEDSTTFAYLRPIFPALFVPKILAILLSLLSSYTWLFDVAIQMVRLWKLEATYSKAAIPDLPEVAYGSTDKETDQPETSQVFLLMCLKTFLTPRMIIGFTLTPLLLTALAVWYPHVKSNCVDSRNGTFLANYFVAPAMMNEANTLGNAYYLKAELQCYKTQRSICQRMQTQTITRFAASHSSFSDVNDDFNGSGRILSVIAGCVQKNTTHAILDSCCGIKGFQTCEASSSPGYCPHHIFDEIPIAYRPLHEYLMGTSCTRQNLPKESLTEPIFDCNKMVKVCEKIPCLGANKDSLRAETIEIDCQVELYALDFLFFVFLTIFHAVSVNLVSTLLFNGVRTVAWRKLCPEGVRLKATLRENGSLATGDNHEDRFQRISIAIRRFELAGKLQIASGFVLLLVWSFVAFC